METTNRALLTNQAMHIMYHSSVGILHLNLSKQKRNGIGDSTIYQNKGTIWPPFFFSGEAQYCFLDNYRFFDFLCFFYPSLWHP